MQLRDYGRVLARRWWIVILLAAIGAASGYVASKSQTPIFRSTARLFVEPNRPDYGNILTIQQIIRSYSQKVTSARLLSEVAADLRLDLTAADMKSKVRATGTADNLAIDITVDDPSPSVAERIARGVVQRYIFNHQESMRGLEPRDVINVDVFDEPGPGALDRPRTPVNTSAGLALGLVVGLLLLFVLDYLDDTVKDQEGLDRFVQLPMVGTIPRMAAKSATGGEMAKGENRRLINHRDPRSPIAEAFRQLRTNIQFSSLDKPVKTLLVTSSVPQEGKSTTLANLAITFAQTGSRVILVDADLRRPTMHTLFKVSNQTGLTNLMVAPDLADLNTVQTDVENLRILPTGPLPPNPSEILGSKRMGEVIERLKEEADYVLFDTPPIVAVTDAAVLATRVDGVVLVVMANRTKRDLAQRAKAQLEKVGANILGVVLNNVKYDTALHDYYAKGG